MCPPASQQNEKNASAYAGEPVDCDVYLRVFTSTKTKQLKSRRSCAAAPSVVPPRAIFRQLSSLAVTTSRGHSVHPFLALVNIETCRIDILRGLDVVTGTDPFDRSETSTGSGAPFAILKGTPAIPPGISRHETGRRFFWGGEPQHSDVSSFNAKCCSVKPPRRHKCSWNLGLAMDNYPRTSRGRGFVDMLMREVDRGNVRVTSSLAAKGQFRRRVVPEIFRAQEVPPQRQTKHVGKPVRSFNRFRPFCPHNPH